MLGGLELEAWIPTNLWRLKEGRPGPGGGFPRGIWGARLNLFFFFEPLVCWGSGIDGRDAAAPDLLLVVVLARAGLATSHTVHGQRVCCLLPSWMDGYCTYFLPVQAWFSPDCSGTSLLLQLVAFAWDRAKCWRLLPLFVFS